MITFNSCPICGSERIEQRYIVATKPPIDYEIMPDVKVETCVVSVYWLCQNCGVYFQNPRFSDTELDQYYRKGYYRKLLMGTDEEMDIGESHRAKLDSGIIKRYISRINSHLDVGAGGGYLLNEIGANVKVAVEPDTHRIRVKGLEVYTEIEKVPKNQFDLVTAIHVLEHVADPLGYLRRMLSLAKKGSLVVIEVPTWKSPGGSLRLAHLYHFEPEVLKNMCMKVDLSVFHEEFTPHFLLICRK